LLSEGIFASDIVVMTPPVVLLLNICEVRK